MEIKTKNQLFAILFVNILCINIYTQVYTPNGSSVDYQIISAGNILLFEDQAANWIAARGWTNDVIKTAPATGAYNCHSYAWYKSEGGNDNYWINAFLNSELNNFNPYNYYLQ